MGDDDDIRAALRRHDDDAAFELLLRVHGHAIVGRCHAILRDRALAEDALQVTLQKAFRGRDQLQSVGHVRAWLMQVAARTALDLRRTDRRHQQRIERLRDADVDEVAMPLVLNHAAPGHEQAGLRCCLDELEPDLRAAVLMRYQDDASWEEIASALGASVDAVRMRVKRGMPGLQACLARQGIEP